MAASAGRLKCSNKSCEYLVSTEPEKMGSFFLQKMPRALQQTAQEATAWQPLCRGRRPTWLQAGARGGAQGAPGPGSRCAEAQV